MKLVVQRSLRRFIHFMAVALVAPSVGNAFPAEGFEVFALQGKASESAISAQVGYHNPTWKTDYETLQLYYGTLTNSKNYISVGGSLTVANQAGDKSSYFARFDWIFFETHSIALKFSHDDWKLISTGRDSVGLDYNGFLSWDRGGIYYSIGGYYRWLKQRWNSNWWMPFHFTTSDNEGFLQGVLGWKGSLFTESYYTIDVNTRDFWGYHSVDNMAFDLGFNFAAAQGLTIKLNLGTRVSSILVGAPIPSEVYAYFGFLLF